MGYVYRGRGAPPDELSVLQATIARELELDYALLKKALPPPRLQEARDILEDIQKADTGLPVLSRASLAGLATGAGGMALSAIFAAHSMEQALASASLSAGLMAMSLLSMEKDKDAARDKARQKVLVMLFSLANTGDALPQPGASVPWRDARTQDARPDDRQP